jgi:tRNA(fMet)-specific endonuclease VapC
VNDLRLLDSSVLIRWERGQLTEERIFAEEGQYSISAIVVSELRVGALRSGKSTMADKRYRFVDDVVRQFEVIPFDLACAEAHSKLEARQMSQGRPLGAKDLIIAATAIAHNARVLPCDRWSFPYIDGLEFDLIAE